MKIIEVKCLDCGAEYETIDAFLKETQLCLSCEGKDLEFKETGKEFKGCRGPCSSCTTCK